MLQRWNEKTHALEPLGTLPASGWVHAAAPGAEERRALEAAGIAPALLAYALDPDEVARVDHDGACALVVLRVPAPGNGDGVPFRTTTLGVIFREGLVVTVSAGGAELAAALAARQGLDPSRTNHFVLNLVGVCAANYLAHLRDIERAVDTLEEELEASLRNREVLGLLKYQKALVHFTTGLEANELMLSRLPKDARFAVSAEDQALLEDAQVELRQALQMTRITEEILSQMMDAFASIISNNLNVVMKVLTALTLVLTFPTMVASFYGMNVDLPLQHHPLAFFFVLLGSFTVAGAVAFFFWRKRWL
ncbi:MAG: magnesium transporter CorA family protein [Myxococcales bacterium]|nr:magnesium transporter CorA family protein [Myxococcales bacterium]